MMKAEDKARWIKALRSGKYAQTKSNLRDDRGYCCLGVLVDVKHWSFRRADDGGFLTDSYCNRAGLEVAVARRLAEMNDDGKSFEVIAEVIERSKEI